MKLPRDLSDTQLIKALERLDYRPTRQTGSHVRLTAPHTDGEHRLTVPLHVPLRIGALAAILADVATHRGMTRDALISALFGK